MDSMVQNIWMRKVKGIEYNIVGIFMRTIQTNELFYIILNYKFKL